MSRPLRIEYPGAWYHVMNRGRRKESIFLQPDDYDTFLQRLRKTESDWHLSMLGAEKADRRKAYIDFVSMQDSQEITDFY